MKGQTAPKQPQKKSPAPDSSQALARQTLKIASFTCGAVVMVLEMVGSRVMAPYMGTSIVVWTALIGIVMASLAAGYWLGGRVADKSPTRSLLVKIILGAAAAIAVTALAANPLLAFITRAIPHIYAGAVVGALLVFTLPSVILGMVSPTIVKLATESLQTTGATVGGFSALSTAGSILGTFLGGFFLISVLPSVSILFLCSAVLAVVAFIVHRGARAASAVLTALFLTGAWGSFAYGDVLLPRGTHFDTQYNHIRVFDGYVPGIPPVGVRVLQTDPVAAQTLMYINEPNELYSGYTKFYDLAFNWIKPKANAPRRVLMLGGGGYAVPKHVMATQPDVRMDVVEIDPGMTRVAREFFELKDDARLAIFHEDARTFLNREAQVEGRERYDAIFSDTFSSWYSIPFHLTTVECARRIEKLLTDDGVLIMNVHGSVAGDPGRLLRGIRAALAEVFPAVDLYPVDFPESGERFQNIMIAAAKRPFPGGNAPSEEVARLLLHRWAGGVENDVAPFTDAFAPVERLVSEYLAARYKGVE